MQFNENEVRKAISILKPDNELFEIRILQKSGYMNSGYFNSIDTLVEELNKQDLRGCAVYITLNHLNSALTGREQFGKIIQNKTKTPTTSDNDVVGYEWIFIDLDPKRPTGTSSSDEELQKAKDLGNRIYHFMETIGFNKPLVAYSGNGVHLLYKIKMANDKTAQDLVKKCLETLSMLFSNDEIDVDTKNFNPSRICKLYGTMACKGRNSEDRPHRISYIVGNNADIRPTDVGYLKKLCDMQPKVDEPRKYNNYNPREFNLEEWMTKYGIRYRTAGYADGTKYILENCPFDSNHKGKDACIFHARNGAIGFHCFHNSCSGKTWQDVRMLYEPDAYEKKNQQYENQIYGNHNRDTKPKPQPINPEDGKPVFYTAMDIYKMPKQNEEFVKSGIHEIDRYMRGLKKGYVSVVSGLRGSSKSTVLSEIALNAVNDGNNVGFFSGELSEKNFMKWMNLQAAGKGKVEPGKYEGYFNVPYTVKELIAEWLGNHFKLYNNEYGNKFEAIIEQFEKEIEENNLDLVILDNLMAFDISSLSDNKYDAQTQFTLNLERLAKRRNVHIVFVAHPRKALGFLRLDDISGTADLGNAVDNAFIVHRVNNDFKRLTRQMFGWKDDDPVYQATNVIEIAKDRDGGIQDKFVPLWYEKETKRIKNSLTENVIYGWDKMNDGFMKLDDGEEAPFPSWR